MMPGNCSMLFMIRLPRVPAALLIYLLLAGYARGQAVAEKVAGKPAGAESGINARFVDPELDVDEWVRRFEIESREIYAGRNQVLRALQLAPGQRVADVGAGTGFFTRLFADAVGPSGWVYAIDISPRFVQHITAENAKAHIRNITSVLSATDDICLPPDTVDVVFVCDTYHHFENPSATLQSIHRALRPGGRLFVIDFERIPGQSREWVLGHVRGDKATFRGEIAEAGFAFVGEIDVPEFSENYLLHFRKRS